MKKENKRKTAIEENIASDKKTSIRKRIISSLGYLAVFAIVLFFFTPESWWQFGVAPPDGRKSLENFTLKSIEGKEWNFKDQRGRRVVVVNYWATWCLPCRVETPGLVNVANEYKERGVEVAGVTLDENLEVVPPFVKKYQIKYPILLPGADPNLTADGMALPTTFLYDKNGRLAKKYTGIVLESTLKSDIEMLLAETN